MNVSLTFSTTVSNGTTVHEEVLSTLLLEENGQSSVCLSQFQSSLWVWMVVVQWCHWAGLVIGLKTDRVIKSEMHWSNLNWTGIGLETVQWNVLSELFQCMCVSRNSEQGFSCPDCDPPPSPFLTRSSSHYWYFVFLSGSMFTLEWEFIGVWVCYQNI